MSNYKKVEKKEKSDFRLQKCLSLLTRECVIHLQKYVNTEFD